MKPSALTGVRHAILTILDNFKLQLYIFIKIMELSIQTILSSTEWKYNIHFSFRFIIKKCSPSLCRNLTKDFNKAVPTIGLLEETSLRPMRL